MTALEPITVSILVDAPMERVWSCWNEPEHIVLWDSGSPDWHTPKALNDLQVGGKFVITMAAKDGSAEFDFSGTYTDIVPFERIAYTMDDGRKAIVTFEQIGDTVRITEVFDPETMNSRELQRDGWQGILNNFKAHVEQQ